MDVDDKKIGYACYRIPCEDKSCPTHYPGLAGYAGGAAPQLESPKPWRKLPQGYWFFEDTPSCTHRYSVQERTSNGCSIVCSTPYHHEGAKRDMREIVEAHNRALQGSETTVAELSGSSEINQTTSGSQTMKIDVQAGYRVTELDGSEEEIAQPESKWISVEEKLPEKDERVLVLRSTQHWVDIECYYKQDRWSSGFYADGEMDTNVTHWQPLPHIPDPPLANSAAPQEKKENI